MEDLGSIKDVGFGVKQETIFERPAESALADTPGTSSDSSTNSIYSRLPGPRYIRVLELLPGAPGTRLRCQLEVKSLDDNPEYEALSYLWGNASDLRGCRVNKKSFQITGNLSAALASLRRPRGRRVLWVDAVCINQADLSERSQQVELMRDVYQHASCVLIWLGEQDEQSNTAFDYFQSLCSTVGIRDLTYWEPHLAGGQGFGQPMKGGQRLMHTDEIAAVSATFSDRPWWSRIWTIQEAVNAREALVMCGQRALFWSRLGKLLHSGLVKENVHAQLHGVMDKAIFFMGLQRQKRKVAGSISMDATLCSLLVNFDSNGCTDPRDRVYALQHVADERFPLNIDSDYHKSVTRVFAEASKATMRSSGLEFLFQASSRKLRPKTMNVKQLYEEIITIADGGVDHVTRLMANHDQIDPDSNDVKVFNGSLTRLREQLKYSTAEIKRWKASRNSKTPLPILTWLQSEMGAIWHTTSSLTASKDPTDGRTDDKSVVPQVFRPRAYDCFLALAAGVATSRPSHLYEELNTFSAYDETPLPGWAPDWSAMPWTKININPPTYSSTTTSNERLQTNLVHTKKQTDMPWWCLPLQGIMIGSFEILLRRVDTQWPQWKEGFLTCARQRPNGGIEQRRYVRALQLDDYKPKPESIAVLELKGDGEDFTTEDWAAWQEWTTSPDFEDILSPALDGWQFGKTSLGYWAWFPAMARESDGILKVPGSLAPLVVRKTRAKWDVPEELENIEFWEFIGMAYVQGFMGESEKDCIFVNADEQTFHLV